MFGLAAVQDVDWKCLFHAYGVADDTPDHLRNLTGQDVKAREAALDHLTSAVVHQSSNFSVTPAAVRVVAGLLGEPVLREADFWRRDQHYACESVPSLSDSAPHVRREAAAAIAQWGALEPHSASAHAAADVIRGHLERSTDPEERASLAEALKALGRDASQWLDD